ncbi:MAG: lipopolysaccharide biosynthesis protein [Ruminococcaceae bacterium]|nr:lipopolysaccharide biosynthesis protein [Oscillospiraceae bacterium]
MTETSKNNLVFSNFLWRLLERGGAQGVTFIVSIILARLLDPALYGTIALVTVFTAILQVFVDSGMGTALIQKKDADDLDFSTVFWFNLAMCLALYALTFAASPWIAQFYRRPELTPLIRVLSLTLVISGVKNIQQAYVSRNMLFKRFFFATLGGTLGAAVVGIWMAYRGFGVWALVVQNLFNATVDTVILWLTVKWRPKAVFSFERLRQLFSYGWKLLASSLLDTGYRELRQLIIGKMYTSEDLAFYNKGNLFPKTIVLNINTSIDSVLLPTMSKAQDDCEKVKMMTRRAIKTSTYIMAPMMIGLAVCAEPVVDLLLTAKWLPCVPYLRVFCFAYLIYPINTANLNAIKAMGRSDYFLKLEIIKKTVDIIVLLATMWFGPLVMAYSTIFTRVVNQTINAWPNKKLLNYPYLEQLKDILPGVSLALCMGAVVYLIQLIGLNDWLTLLIQIPTGVVLYVGGSVLFHMESYEYVLNAAKEYLHKKEK